MKWPPAAAELHGQGVVLVPMSEEHREPLRQAADDERIWQWMDRRVPAEPGAFDEWFDTRMSERRAVRQWPWVTSAASGGAVLGTSSYLAVREEHDGLEIGWTWLRPGAWRSGANVEAKLLMLDYAFETLGCMRVEFKTDARNERSRRALEALPATFEGIFRKHMLVPGVGVRDSAYYSITDDDWPAVRDSLAARLEAGSGVSAGA